jgi:dTDP-4-dehydrorhamnose 3,5-epimerase
MNVRSLDIEGLYVIESFVFRDHRGAFVKPYNEVSFGGAGLKPAFKECFFSSSKMGTLRGMHFQIPPSPQAKLVCAVSGKVVDVALDLRRNSPSYGEHRALELSEDEFLAFYIPEGFAHGFQVLSESATLLYLLTENYDPQFDRGIRYDSFGMEWPLASPVLSDRDLRFPELKDFDSPFE